MCESYGDVGFPTSEKVQEWATIITTDQWLIVIVQYGLTSQQTHYRSYRDDITGQMTQPKVSSTEGQLLVNPPGKGPILPGQAKVK